MTSRFHFLIVLFLLVFSLQSANAGISQHLAYQGVLTDTAGNPRPDRVYSFVFQLYDDSISGTLLWSEEKALYVTNGIFSTFLGSVTPFGSTVKFDKPYWLGIKVDGVDLTPRVPLGSAAYSLRAQWADTAEYAREIDSSSAIISYLLKEVDTLKKQVSTLTLENLPIGTVIGSMDSLDESNGVWVLADGRAATTEYTQATGNDSIPDLRGMFLRGLNAGRSDGKQDPVARITPGEYQEDALKNHNHGYKVTMEGDNGWFVPGGTLGGLADWLTTDSGDVETRPRNCAVFWYVKVK